MTLCIKVPFAKAESVKEQLRQEGRFNEAYRYGKEEGYILFPVTERFESPYDFVDAAVAEVEGSSRLKDLLKEQLSEEELAHVKSSFDTVGSIALIEVDDLLVEKEQVIGKALLDSHKSITTVLKKLGGHEGELRLQKYGFLAGEDTRETTVKENGVVLKINVEEVYYSVRSATERKRIASLVKKDEHILVMFSGAAPYPCVLSKLTGAAEVVGVELNESGHELGVENVRLNKLSNVVLVHGDVREVVPEFAGKGILFDRVVMPLPHTGKDFLDEALSVAKPGTVVHLYDFEHEDEFEKAGEKVLEGAKRNDREVKILGIVPSGQHSPRVFRVCVDFEVL